jgi:YgiT-type zinc finger domain-containing protein
MLVKKGASAIKCWPPGNTESSRKNKMSDFLNKPCSECGGELRRRSIQKEFERGGTRVKLDGIRAWVCESCGEVYFEPGGADRLADAVNCLFELALAERQQKGQVSATVS